MGSRFNWRRLLVATHRDLGFFFVGLTLIYAISGLAVNHVSDWNPNYAIQRRTVAVASLPGGDTPAAARAVLAQLAVTEPPRSIVPAGPDRFQIFLTNRTITVDVSKRQAVDERVSPRPLLYQLNFLHLNHGKGPWTWFADVYAVGLLLLAVSGMLMVLGRRGIAGRGLLWLLAGLVPPIVFVFWKG